MTVFLRLSALPHAGNHFLKEAVCRLNFAAGIEYDIYLTYL
jgi:hypothetical protein